MAKKKDIESLVENLKSDLKKANNKEIDNIYEDLKRMLKKYDEDSFFKNVIDWFGKLFHSKRKKCELILIDIIEGLEKDNFLKKEELRKDLLDLSNIHRDFLENIKALIESL